MFHLEALRASWIQGLRVVGSGWGSYEGLFAVSTVYYLLWEGKRPPCNDLAITCRTARHRAQTCCRSQGPACRNSSSAPPAQRTPFSLDSDRHQGDTVESGRLGRGEGGVGRPCLRPALALTPRGQACPSARGLLPFGRHHRVWEASRLRPLLTHASPPPLPVPGSLLRGQRPRDPRPRRPRPRCSPRPVAP